MWVGLPQLIVTLKAVKSNNGTGVLKNLVLVLLLDLSGVEHTLSQLTVALKAECKKRAAALLDSSIVYIPFF